MKCKLLLDNQHSLEEHEFNSNSKDGRSWLLAFIFQTSVGRWSLRNLCNSIETNNSKLVTVNEEKYEIVLRFYSEICRELVKEGNENAGNYVEISLQICWIWCSC